MMTETELAQLDERMAWLADAAELLMSMDRDTPGYEYVIEAIRRDLEHIGDPVRRLIAACLRSGSGSRAVRGHVTARGADAGKNEAERRRGKRKRKSQVT